MPNIGAAEIIMIVLVALVVFGPRKLPELGRTVGQALREFRSHTSSVTNELRSGLDVSPPVPQSVPAAQVMAEAPVEAVVPVAAKAS